jgi:hypothetical protein
MRVHPKSRASTDQRPGPNIARPAAMAADSRHTSGFPSTLSIGEISIRATTAPARGSGPLRVPGMRERAELMGGTLTVWSKEGAGTAVELFIASRSAYVKTRERRWLSRAFAGE